MTQREYRAALRGDSWKFQLINCIDRAMATSRSKQEFIKQMRKMGYEVKWQDSHKYITYTTPQGQKSRDNKLYDERYLKIRMKEFYELGKTQSAQQAGKSDRQLPDTATILRAAPRNAGATAHDVVSDSTGISPHAGANQQIADMGQPARNTNAPASGHRQTAGSGDRQQRSAYQAGNTESNERYEDIAESDNNEQDFRTGADARSPRPDPVETSPEMGGNGSDVAAGILGIAVAIENLVNPLIQNDDEQQKKTIPKQRKKQRKSHEKDWAMEM